MNERPPADPPQTDEETLVAVDPAAEAQDIEEAAAFSRAAVWAVPVAIAHIALIYFIFSAVTGFRLPAFFRSDALVAWLWINGAAVGLGIWAWKKGRVQVSAGTWMTGRRAKLAILAWLGLSLLWFLLPGLLGALWRAVSGSAGGW
ncbi:MAG TPA: hypothetical protein VF552_16160 [Allosphingosinicella sp.]|jgi:hypothetical protein